MMTLHPWTLAAILGMAAATYLCRAGGYWLFRQITPGPLLRAALTYIPGTLFVSFVTPRLLDGQVHTLAGALGTVLVMLWTRSLAWAILGGTACAWLAWSLM